MRSELLAAMNTDIARYSQESEWAFYREHGYGVLPVMNETEPDNETALVDRNSTSSEDDIERERRSRRVEALRELWTRREADLRARRARTSSNRATLPAQLSQEMEAANFADLPDLTQDFLAHLLNRRT